MSTRTKARREATKTILSIVDGWESSDKSNFIAELLEYVPEQYVIDMAARFTEAQKAHEAAKI